MNSLGEATLDLLWLSPSAHSLMALARSPFPSVWPQLRTDPGLVLLFARAWSRLRLPTSIPRGSDVVLRRSLSCLRTAPDAGFVDWAQPACALVYRSCIRQAQLAAALAELVGDCNPLVAWVGGVTASLGWLAASAVDPTRAEDGRTAQTSAFEPAIVARRLSHYWRLPPWLSTIAGHLGLGADLAGRLGANRTLFQVVQLAVLLRLREQSCPRLDVGAEIDELADALRLTVEQVEQIAQRTPVPPESNLVWQSPAKEPLLQAVLELAIQNRRLARRTTSRTLHDEIDHLQEALRARRLEEARRLHAMKLSALAEFAAGAGHEINNPLAVISGQAQYLLRQFEAVDGPLEEIDNPVEYLANLKTQLGPSLRKIIGQTQRIHGILTELMQFARPPLPQAQPIDAGAMMHEVATSLQAFADERRVRLVILPPESPILVRGDVSQVRASLQALLRNAIEAAPAGGWAGVRLEEETPHRLALVVEDSGIGPGPLAQQHLFDPFYSGRTAGRGRGLGLPTAWRLARQQEGDLRFDGTRDGVTRFSLVLPVAPASDNGMAVHVNGRNGVAHHSE